VSVVEPQHITTFAAARSAMENQSILIVEDEENIRELLSYNLQQEGFRVTGVEYGEAALAAVHSHQPDLIVLDLMLPGIDGLTVCQKLKADPATATIPIVMVTARGEEADVVRGLELGADDYITKPFSPRVVVARIRAVLRRHGNEPSPADAPLEIHNLKIHPGRHEVLADGKSVQLTRTEFRLLHLLAERPGWVFTRRQISTKIHDGDYVVTERSIDVQIASLRKKLDKAGKWIETVRGVGYRFKEP
jgi:two-component system phosphate regulon response regulator PhoB